MVSPGKLDLGMLTEFAWVLNLRFMDPMSRCTTYRKDVGRNIGQDFVSNIRENASGRVACNRCIVKDFALSP
jgi:hypothetical protein